MGNKFKNRTTWSFILGMLLLGVVAAISLYQIYFTNRITVINNAPVKANEVIVSVCGNNVVFKNINPEAKQSQKFTVSGDSGFTITASFNDGTRVEHSFGYVTGGAGSYGNKVDIELTPAKAINAEQH